MHIKSTPQNQLSIDGKILNTVDDFTKLAVLRRTSKHNLEKPEVLLAD